MPQPAHRKGNGSNLTDCQRQFKRAWETVRAGLSDQEIEAWRRRDAATMTDQELPRLGLPDSRNATRKLISAKVELRSELRMSWDTLLPCPIPVPGSKPLVTLRDAGMRTQKLPKSQADLRAWRTATEALMLAAEDRRPLMHADDCIPGDRSTI